MESESSDTSDVALSSLIAQKLPEIKAIASIITCAICYGSVKDPLTTAIEGCGHTFCSLCVRGYLAKFKQQCPQCFKELHDSNLLINRPLNSITQYVLTLIPKLEALIRGSKPENNSCSKDVKIETSNSSLVIDNDETITKNSEIRLKKEPLQEINFQETSSITSEDSPTANQPSDSVSCPVCQISILQRNVNVHLDACLGNKKSYVPTSVKSEGRENNVPTARTISSSGQSSFFGKSNATTTSKPTKINKVVYYLLKDPDLRKLLKKEGLDMQGDRKTLINRHQRFTILWNSQCDSEKPLSRLQIINKLKREEQNLSEASSSSPTTSTLLNYDRNTNPDIIETKQKAYIQKNQSHFDKLIQQLKERKKEEKSQISDPHKSKRQKLDDEKSNDDDPVKIESHATSAINSQHFQEPTTSVSRQIPKERSAVSSPVEKTKNLNKDIRPLENIIKKSSDDAEILQPISSSTPKSHRLKHELDSDLIGTRIHKPLIVNSESDSEEQVVLPNDKDSDETITTKRKSKLSLSRRYGAGSTKKTPCPVCQELIRESLINFHLDHCLGQSSSNCEASTVVTRARLGSKVEKVTANDNSKPHDKKSPSKTNSYGSKRVAEPDTSIELFKDDSEDELNFPLSQLHNPQNLDKDIGYKTSLPQQHSQIKRISSADTLALLNITPEITEMSQDTDDVNFSELIDDNLQNPSTVREKTKSLKEKFTKKCIKTNDTTIHHSETSTNPVDESHAKSNIKTSSDTIEDERNLCNTRLPSKRTTRASRAAMKNALK